MRKHKLQYSHWRRSQVFWLLVALANPAKEEEEDPSNFPLFLLLTYYNRAALVTRRITATNKGKQQLTQSSSVFFSNAKVKIFLKRTS